MSNHLKYLFAEIESMDDDTPYMVISEELKVYGKTMSGAYWKLFKSEYLLLNQ
jgi:hypothetical protein